MREIETLSWRRSQVEPSPNRPHHLIREGPAGSVYAQVESTNRRADAELIDELVALPLGRGLRRATPPGLELGRPPLPSRYRVVCPFRARHRRRDLKTLRLVRVHQGRTVPTVGERFLFGHGGEHGRHVLEVWIQAGRFAGTDNSRIVDRIEIHSFPVQALGEAIAFRKKHSWPGAEIGEVRGIDLSTRATRTQLVRLIDRGLVRAIRTSPKGHQRNDVSVEAPPR